VSARREYDVVIAGSGIAGMAAGIESVRAGAKVLILEKDRKIGGNSRWAYGFDLEAYTFEDMRRTNPEGDHSLQRALVDDFEPSLQWLRSLGVLLEEEYPGRYGFHPRQGDGGMLAFRALEAAFAAAGGDLQLGTGLDEILIDGTGRVTGVIAAKSRIRTRAVVLATGGFGGNAELKGKYIGANGSATGFYGTDFHDGDGFVIGLSVGAAPSTGTTIPTGTCIFPPPFMPPEGESRLGAGGHLSAEPIPAGIQALLIRPPITQQPSLMVNLAGKRYVDEGAIYTVIGLETTAQPAAMGFCIFDRRVFEMERSTLTLAMDHGAVVYRADTVDALAVQMRAWRSNIVEHQEFDASQLARTVAEFSRLAAIGRGQDLVPGSTAKALPLDQAPFFAVPVVQGVVDMAGGLRTDDQSRVLDASARPIPGLFAAGADGGRPYTLEHGGLAYALISGRRAGINAAAGAHARESL